MKTQWDLTKLISSEDPEFIENLKSQIESAWNEFIQKWEKNNDYLFDPSTLKVALDEYEALTVKYGIDGGLSYYFELKDALEQGNSNTKAQINKIEEFTSNLVNKIQFFSHRISKIDKADQQKFLESDELKEYKHFLERSFEESAYLLTEDQEKIVNLLSKPAKYNWTQMVESFLANDQERVLTEEGTYEKRPLALIGPMMDTKNENVRESAFKAILKIRSRWASIAENEINSILEYKRNSDLLRGFKTPEASRHLSDDIDSEVVNSMVESVTSKYSVIQDYFRFKAKILGKNKLKAQEAMLGIEYLDKTIDSSRIKAFTLDQAVELVGSVMKSLDPEFENIYNDFFDEGRVDVFPKKGKVNGAFCASVHKNQPVYILLNFTGKMQDCLTLAHEMGHGINDVLMRNQNELNYGTVLSTAEVASTFMEDFVWQKIYSEADDEQKFVLIMQKIEDDIGTIFMQVACYTFEQNLHQEFRKLGYLSKEMISTIFIDSFKPLYGNSVDFKKTKDKWVSWTHIRSFFYVYSYASGLLISKSLQKSVKDNPDFINKVKDFLSAGTSQSPKDIFNNLGIDITKKEFWNNGLDEIEELIIQAKELAKKLNRYK